MLHGSADIATLAEPLNTDTEYARKRSFSAGIVPPPSQMTLSMLTEALFCHHSSIYTRGFVGIAMLNRGYDFFTALTDVAMPTELCSIDPASNG